MRSQLVYTIIDLIFRIYSFMLITKILSSWFPNLRDNAIIRFISFYTDPYLNLFRRIIPPLGMLDLSPIAAFFALQFLEILIKNMLFR